MKAKKLFDANNENRLTIVTNNKPRLVLNGWELTPDELAEFDYIDRAYSVPARFVRYRGEAYDLEQFVGAPDFLAKDGWDMVLSETAWSGVLATWWDMAGDGEYRIKMGSYWS